MRVTEIHHTPIGVVAFATRTAYESYDKGDTDWDEELLGTKDTALVSKVVRGYKHGSVAEHCYVNYFIQDIPRYILQELVRHRHASYTVKSTRFTLGKDIKKGEVPLYDNMDPKLFEMSCRYYDAIVQYAVDNDIKNDQLKKIIPENLLTTLVFTINIRSLRNFFTLRTASGAHEDIQLLAHKIYEATPESYKFLLEDTVNEG